MSRPFNLYDVYEQNLNFLFGAGASFGFLPTLALKLQMENGDSYTFETLAKELEESEGSRGELYTLLFMYYYQRCIEPGLPGFQKGGANQDRVLYEYGKFLETLLSVLQRQGRNDKKCNIYTSNYDNCFELAADKLVTENRVSCVFNDGSAGFQKREFHTKNFNTRVIHKGIFDKHEEMIPQVNILHPHGSVYWVHDSKGIEVSYEDSIYKIELDEQQRELINGFGAIVEDQTKDSSDLVQFKVDNKQQLNNLRIDDFWSAYKDIPIVNPTKWKFHETVFEEAYYQILRHLSFELERPNTVLLTFGFSFADEHILHLIQRSLSNPSLTVYVSCFDDNEKVEMQSKFQGYSNVKYISIDDELTFSRFNKTVFTLSQEDDL